MAVILKTLTNTVSVSSARLLTLASVLLIGLAGCESLQLAFSGEPYTTLDTIQGRVLVIRGNQYVVAEKGLTLEPGDQVATLADSGATVLYGKRNVQDEPVGKSCSAIIGADAEHFVSSLEECQGKPKPKPKPKPESKPQIASKPTVEPIARRAINEDVTAPTIEQPASASSTSTRSVAEVIAGWFQPKDASKKPEAVAATPRVARQVASNPNPPTSTSRGLPIVKLKPDATNDSRITNPPLPATTMPKGLVVETSPSPVQVIQPTVIPRAQGSLPTPTVRPVETQIASSTTSATPSEVDSAPIYYAVFAPNLGTTPAILEAGKPAAVAFLSPQPLIRGLV